MWISCFPNTTYWRTYYFFFWERILYWVFLPLFSNISWVYIQRLISGIVKLFHWSMYQLFMALPYCVGYYGFVVYFEIRNCDASSFGLLSQDCFSYLRSFVVSYKFYNCFPIFVKKCYWHFVEIALNLHMAKGIMEI